MQETGVRSLGWEDPLEKEMANHSSILAQHGSVNQRKETMLITGLLLRCVKEGLGKPVSSFLYMHRGAG